MIGRIDITGRKIWNDADNLYRKRPESVEILLLRDGEIYKRITVTAAEDWKYKFSCLPVYRNDGEKFLYAIDETDVGGYRKKIQNYNVVNTLETIPVLITKIWDDDHNAAGLRPSYVEFLFLQNGLSYYDFPITTPPGQDTANTDLGEMPFADNQDKPYVYTLREVFLDNYSASYDGFNITNKLKGS